MYYYACQGKTFASLQPLDLPAGTVPRSDEEVTVLFDRPPQGRRSAFLVTDPRQLAAEDEGVAWLDCRRIAAPAPALPRELLGRMEAGGLRAVNFRHPRWRQIAQAERPSPKKRRLHLLAVGDVGGTLLTALKLLGGEWISTIGICDLNPQNVERWVREMGQISWPWDYDALPGVEAVAPERLFECDVFVFAAAKAIPPVGAAVGDVRMAQFQANRPLVESFARQARAAGFQGLFAVMSDPVDPLCKAAYLASNTGADGQWDGQGLLAQQIQGFGLGVMNARAAALARQEPRFSSFLKDGRSFGPHGEGLVIANSVTEYDDALSQELTELVKTANLRIRDLGYKPFVAPAVSSGAMQLLLAVQGRWHCGSVCLGGVWFGVRNRFTPCGLETETLPLPEELFARLKATEALLREIM